MTYEPDYVGRIVLDAAATEFVAKLGRYNRSLLAENLRCVEAHSDALIALRSALSRSYDAGEYHDPGRTIGALRALPEFER